MNPVPPTQTLPQQDVNLKDRTSVKSQPWPLMMVAGIFILFSVLAVGYFVYQNRQLKEQVDQFSLTPTPVQVTSKRSPTPDPTAKWETYTNTGFKFQVKYPSSWYSNNCNMENFLILDPASLPICETEPFNPIVLVVNDDTRKADEIAQGWLPHFQPISLSPVKVTINHSKYLAEKVQPAPGPDKIIVIYVPIQGGTFVIYVNDLDYETIADQILSTFKFLPSECDSCPQIMPPHPDFCKNGTIIPGAIDECGCQQPPTCQSY